MKTAESTTPAHPVVSREKWLQARVALLAKEKAFTHQYDALVRERQALPWMKVDKVYSFEVPAGKATLGDLFGDRSQLVCYHFMFGPDWEDGCPSCSLLLDHVDGATEHLQARDVQLTMVSGAPLAKIEAFKRRMGWHAPWASCLGSDFNTDFGVSFTKEQLASGAKLYNYGSITPYGEENHGLSVFSKDASGNVFHTYSTFGRGCEPLVVAYTLLDMAPKGRDEAAFDFPMAWVRHHDRYAHSASSACCHEKGAKS